jgi:hypothetical protein
MPRKKSVVAKPAVVRITPEEADRQAQRFVDKLLGKENEFGRRAILEGLNHPQTLDHLSKKTGLPSFHSDPSSRVKFKSALERKDRKKLIAIVKEDFVKNPIPPGKERAFMQVFEPRTWRKGLVEAANQLKGKPGATPLVSPSDYPKLANCADGLRPVIRKILEERHEGNKRTVGECLEFWSQQYPEPCQFLLRHHDKLAELLNAKRLPKLAKKLETQAHVIADSLAGCEEGLKFSTSIERVRQGRRMIRKTLAGNPAN